LPEEGDAAATAAAASSSADGVDASERAAGRAALCRGREE
jgi:hypothetical protein